MLLDKEYKNQEKNKLTFVLTYRPVFQNIKIISEELKTLLPSDKGHFVMGIL